ncbi:endopeptidase La [Helicobacter cinaedi]|uniref:Lon protease n=1 Tax=Helicobacter cinaedi CCUG 18818 = ATCC BAA-847 TaxID=537971 RepID=A0ABN0BC69_9HELI|nr:endopeptidase La [Helicobacter cinaedi]EFR47258.1 endopeptidase La [Helicobacter cinaedi CCUG 18818 = ATCC BAA-847]QOQ90223.1 endopeptidase La [Helicobacter cinaedi]
MNNIENDFPIVMPLVIEDELFIYPFMIAPLFISDESNIEAADKAIKGNNLIFISSTRSDDNQAFYDVGVIGSIMRKVALPDGRVKLLFKGLYRGKILKVIKSSKEPLSVEVDRIYYKEYDEIKMNALLEVLREKLRHLANLDGHFPPDLLKSIEENSEPNRIVDLIASAMRLSKNQAYTLFAKDDVEERILGLIDYIIEETQAQKLQKEIKNKVHNKMEQVNKEYFLKEQLKQIQKELGTDNTRDEEIEQYLQKLNALKPFMGENAYKEVHKQIKRLSRMHQDSGDANILQNYVEWVLEIPFGTYAKQKLSIQKVAKQLDIDHYSLEEPKERIVEYFAVKELIAKRESTQAKETKNSKQKDEKSEKGTILCFYGPPGVGKTSLANSIAKAIKRKLVRIALGGLEDVNELRGHRRTYIGAMPGRIIQGLIEAKEMNPLIVLDEIDKVGRSYRGDPTSVLLEILDPEQNHAFRDYYTNFDVDLSQAIFIATANDISTIPAPLRDRMEFIAISSYTPQEKYEIAKKYLIPQELKKHGLSQNELNISTPALKQVIEKYTREAGVRSLRHKIAQIMRKSAILILKGSESVSVTPKNLNEFLDKIVFEISPADKQHSVGVVNGLAWTSVGGDVLKIEAIKIKGKGALTLTGSLGEVMKESAHIAHSVVKVLLDNKVLKQKNTAKKTSSKTPIYQSYDIHLHVPEGATPKDGPSAGIAMACVIASILTDSKINASVAMTGELTLQGKVLAIGGLKEKLIAAHKAGIQRAIIPQKNYERDLKDIPKEVQQKLEIIGVSDIQEVLKLALLP